MKKATLTFALILLATAFAFSGALAQGGAIAYGQTTTASINAETPQGFFSFNGAAGDIVTAYALGWEVGFQPTLALAGATGQLAFSASDPLTPIGNDVRITYQLPQDGPYSLLVGSANGSQGTYTITLRSAAPAISNALVDAVTLNIPLGAPQQQYSITANPAGPVPVNIQSLTPGFGFTAVLNAPNGNVIAAINGGLETANLLIPAGEGTYTLVISSADPAIAGDLQLSLSGASAAPAAQPQPNQPQQPSVVQPPPNDPNACIVQAANAGGVNVRSGPGTNYNEVGSLIGEITLNATGQNNGWYYGNFAFGTGWVASSVTIANGPCNNLPFVDAPTAPAQQVAPPQATEEVSASPTAPQQPTATQSQPPTPTQPTAQTAAPDSNIAQTYNLKSDSGQQVSSDISYPQGDTEDTVNYTITGYDSVTFRADFSWTLFCNGDTEGVELLRGNRVVGGCNSTYTESINAGNGNGGGNARASFTIRYVSGSDSYVNWTLQMNTVG